MHWEVGVWQACPFPRPHKVSLNRIRNSRKVEMAGNTGFGESLASKRIARGQQESILLPCGWQSPADPRCPDPNSPNLGFPNQLAEGLHMCGGGVREEQPRLPGGSRKTPQAFRRQTLSPAVVRGYGTKGVRDKAVSSTVQTGLRPRNIGAV